MEYYFAHYDDDTHFSTHMHIDTYILVLIILPHPLEFPFWNLIFQEITRVSGKHRVILASMIAP